MEPDSSVYRIVETRDPRTVTSEERDSIYTKGCELIRAYMQYHNQEARSVRSQQSRSDVERGIQLLTFVTKGNPRNWAAHWVIGKAYQALRNSESAYDAFETSFAILKDNADVAR